MEPVVELVDPEDLEPVSTSSVGDDVTPKEEEAPPSLVVSVLRVILASVTLLSCFFSVPSVFTVARCALIILFLCFSRVRWVCALLVVIIALVQLLGYAALRIVFAVLSSPPSNGVWFGLGWPVNPVSSWELFLVVGPACFEVVSGAAFVVAARFYSDAGIRSSASLRFGLSFFSGLLVCIWLPSVVSFACFALFCFGCVWLQLRRDLSLFTAVLSRALFALCALHYMAVCLYQLLPPLPSLSLWLGLLSYTPSWQPASLFFALLPAEASALLLCSLAWEPPPQITHHRSARAEWIKGLIGVYGWIAGLFWVIFVALIFQSAPYSVLLLLSFVTFWIPVGRLHSVLLAIVTVSALVISAANFLFNVLATATTLDDSVVFVYLGLHQLSIFPVYVGIESSGLLALALFWRWKRSVLTPERRAMLFARKTAEKAELNILAESVDDVQLWADGQDLFTLLRAVGCDLEGRQVSWENALLVMQQQLGYPQYLVDQVNRDRSVLNVVLWLEKRVEGTLARLVDFLFVILYYVGVLGLFFCGTTQPHASLFGLTFVCCSMVYLLFGNNTASAFHVLLIAYLQLVILLLFLWQFPFAAGAVGTYAEYVGLFVFSNAWAGFALPTLSMFLLLLSLVHARVTEGSGGFSSWSFLGSDSVFWRHLRTIGASVGLYSIVYAWLVAVFLAAVIENTLLPLVPFLVAGIWAVLMFCPLHRLTFVVLRPLSVAIIVYNAALIFLRYALQFPFFARALPPITLVSYKEIGLLKSADTHLVVFLLGPWLVFVLSLAVLYTLDSVVAPSPSFENFRGADAAEEQEKSATLGMLVHFAQRAFVIFGPPFASLILFLPTATGPPSLIGLAFGVVSLASLWKPRFLVSSVFRFVSLSAVLGIIAVRTLFCLQSLSSGEASVILSWIGVGPSVPLSQLYLFLAISLVMLLLVWFNRAHQSLVQKERSHGRKASAGVLLFAVNAEQASSNHVTPRTALHRLGFFANSAFVLFGFEWVLVLGFLDVFIRQTLWSIVLLLFLPVCYVLSERLRPIALRGFLFVWSLLVLAQYLCLLGLPTVPHYPWLDHVAPAVASWLALSFSPALLLIDFTLLAFVAAYTSNLAERRRRDELTETDRLLADVPPPEEDDTSTKSGVMLEIEGAAPVFTVDKGNVNGKAVDAKLNLAEDSTDESRSYLLSWSEIAHFIGVVSQYVLLVLVFVFGAIGRDLISVVYVAFSLLFLMLVDELLRHRNWWNLLQFYSAMVLLAKLVWQIPWLGTSANDSVLLDLIGLRKFASLAVTFSPIGVLFDLLIVLLVGLQKGILTSSIFVVLNRESQYQRSASTFLLRSMRRLIIFGWIRVLESTSHSFAQVIRSEKQEDVTDIEDDDDTGVLLLSSSKKHDENADTPRKGVKDSHTDGEEESVDWTKSEHPLQNVDTEGLSALEKIRVWAHAYVRYCYIYPWLSMSKDIERHISPNLLRALIGGTFRLVSFHSDVLVYASFVLSLIVNANVLPLFFVVSCWIANCVFPLPKRGYFLACMIISIGIIFWKFFFYLPLLCVCQTNGRVSLVPQCGLCPEPASNFVISWASMLGVGSSVWVDIVVLIALVINRSALSSKGLWANIRSYWGIKNESSEPTSFGHGVKKFFTRLIQRIVPDSDYYSASLFFEVICFCIILFFPQDFSGLTDLSTSTVQQLLQASTIPVFYLLALLHQFLLIVVDRILYLRQWSVAKFVLLVLQVLFYNAMLVFVLPFINDKPFSASPALIAFYVFKSFYLYFASRQVRDGYALVPMEDEKSITVISYYLYMVYRAIPFLFELRHTIDWWITPTTLRFMDWFLLEDIHGQLIMCQGRILDMKSADRKKGDTQKLWMKLLLGGGLAIFFIGMLWFPLFLLSSANPSLQANPVIKADVQVAVRGWVPLFTSNTEIVKPVDADTFAVLKKAFKGYLFDDDLRVAQIVSFANYSETVWTISPEGYRDIRNALAAAVRGTAAPPVLEVTANFYRVYGQPLMTADITTPIPPDVAGHLLDVLNYALNCTSPSNPEDVCNSFIAIKAIPRFFRLPVSAPVIVGPPESGVNLLLGLTRSVHSYKYRTANDTLEANVFTEFWNAKPYNVTNPLIQQIFSPDSLEVVVFSSEVPGFLASLASGGVIAIYVGVVLAVGRFVRLAFADQFLRVTFERLRNPVPLLRLCNHIKFARKFYLLQKDSNVTGLLERMEEFGGLVKHRETLRASLEALLQANGFELEETLFEKLIEVVRNPQKMIAATDKTKTD